MLIVVNNIGYYWATATPTYHSTAGPRLPQARETAFPSVSQGGRSRRDHTLIHIQVRESRPDLYRLRIHCTV
jgi:hypothetical protein